MDPEGVGTQQGAGGDAQRDAVRVVAGQRVGDLARPLPTQIRRPDVAVGRPRPGAHVPAVGGVQIAGGLQMFGYQGSVLLGRCWITRLNRGRDALVQIGAIRFEL